MRGEESHSMSSEAKVTTKGEREREKESSCGARVGRGGGGEEKWGQGPQVSRTGRCQGPGLPGVVQLEPLATLDVCLTPTSLPPTWSSRADMEHSSLSISPQSPSEQNACSRSSAHRLSFHLNRATSSPQTPREPGLLPLAASLLALPPSAAWLAPLVLLLPGSQQPSWGWSTAICGRPARLGQPIQLRGCLRLMQPPTSAGERGGRGSVLLTFPYHLLLERHWPDL